MVEFKIKTMVNQDCTIDAANADLYDGNSEFLKAGGKKEPKKSLFRFNIAEKPNFGDANLSHAELGIYTTGVTKGQSSKIPQFNIYKMKSSASGEDWGAGGRIRTITRGKRIVKTDDTNNILTVRDHGLFTGDIVTYSPFVNYYGDCDLGADVKYEKEYYVVRRTRDELYLAATLSAAVAGTPLVSIGATDSSTPQTEKKGSDFANFPSGDASNYGIAHYGWLRSEKYTSDIHIVTSWYDNAECLAEDFNGSKYRESDMDYQYAQRSVIRRGEPYLDFGNLVAELYDSKSDSHAQNGDEDDLQDWYGYKVSNGNAKDMVKLKSHKSNADGSGWWRTKKTSRWSGKDDYVPKHLPQGSKTKNPAVKYDDEILTGAEPYGDEITPENCFFHRVKSAAEFQEAAETDGGANVLQATGAIKFSTKKVKTGGQSMNVYQFWKKDAIGVDYTSSSGLISGRQECMVLRKDIPWAPYLGLNYDLSGLFDHAPDQSPPGNNSLWYSPQTPSMNITMNIEKLEKAWSKGASSSTDNIYMSRGITFIFAEIPPTNSETLYEYLTRLGKDDASTHADGDTFGDASGSNCLGWSVINTDMGIRLFSLHDAVFDVTNTDLYWVAVKNQVYASFADGSDQSSHATVAQDETDARTGISEGEWYDFKVFHANHEPYGTYGKSAHLRVEDAEGNACHFIRPNSDNTFDEYPFTLYNCKANGFSSNGDYGQPLAERNADDSTNYPTKSSWWGKHMSIWFSNRKSDYATGTGKGQDWMGGWDKENSTSEDRDTENNIFIDSLAYKNINQSHSNSTLGQVGGGSSRDRITISSGRKYDSMRQGNMGGSYGKHSSAGNREGISNTSILIGVEDPSQISSHCQVKKSWRYLYFQDYQCANLSADAPLMWTADGTLPHEKGASTSTYLEAGTAGTQKWFSDVSGFLGGDATSTRYWDNYDNQVLDYGFPMTYNAYINDLASTSNQLAPSITTSYTSAADSIGMQWGTANIEQRELHMNRTGGWSNKDTTETFDHNEGTQGGIGANLRMHQTAPALGMVTSPDEYLTDNTLQVEDTYGGPDAGDAHHFLTGAKVVYANLSVGNDISINGKASNLGDNTSSASLGDFTDNPADGVGTYYIIRVGTSDKSDPSHYTDEATRFKLASSYANAIAGTALPLVVNSASGSHMFYDYEYYRNRYYYTNGFSQKGFNRLILQPTLDDDDVFINAEFKNNDGTEDSADKHGDEEKYYLCKREHMSCSAKILEIADESVMSSSSTGNRQNNEPQNVQLRVDTTTPLCSTEGTRYRVFVPVTASDVDNYASNLTIQILDEENIIIEGWNGYSDKASGPTKLLEKDKISELWISPEKYWIYYNIRPSTGDTATGAKGVPNKSYGNITICAPSGSSNTGTLTGAVINDDKHLSTSTTVFADAEYEAWGAPGATYNESTANFDRVGGINGAYINAWSPELHLNKNKTIFDLSDFGFGAGKADKDNTGGENGIIGGNVSSFIPKSNQINYIKMPKIFTGVEEKKEGDNLDLAVAAESSMTDGIIGISSGDNSYLPKPFLLTVFEDEKPDNPTDFKVGPYKKDAFLPEFTWSSSGSDLWYGFIIIDDRPINSQYHNSLLHVPLNEDLKSVATGYHATKGWRYDDESSPIVYGYRYENTSVTPSGLYAGSALAQPATTKITAADVELYDNIEGLAGNTKYFEEGYVQFNFHPTTAGSSDINYPVDEMSVVVHVTPDSWGDNRWICSFNELGDTGTAKDSWGIYLDGNGQVNAYVGAGPGTTHPTTHIQLKSTTKLPVDGTPTCIILTIDTQLHSGNAKLFINGKLEDQSGLRGTLSINNWPTDADGVGGEAIFYDTNSTTAASMEKLFIGAKSVDSNAGQNDFIGRIEEFVWYDKCIYPVTPQNGKFVLEKPLEELMVGSATSSSKSYNARLFIKDYHNIRGKTTGEVAASSQVSFKKAAFELYT